MIVHLYCVVLCFVLYGTIGVNTEKANLINAHHLIKRQTQDVESASYPRRHFVSPGGDYDYHPPVSSGRMSQASSEASVGGGLSGRQATTQVTIGGGSSGRHAKTHLGVADPRYSATSSTGPRGRTYTYPFGRERVQYSGSQSQGHDQQAHRSPDSEAGIDWQQEAVPSQRQHPLFSASNQRSVLINFQNYSSQAPPNQQSSYDASALHEHELRRKQDEMRRRYEDERRRQGEERRRLLDERRRQEEERRRQHYEQQQRVNQQQSQVRENNHGFLPNLTRHEHPGLTDNRRQQPSMQTYTERRVASVDPSSPHYPHNTERTHERGAIIPPSKVTGSSQQPERSPPHHQLPVINSHQGTNPQTGYRTNSSQFSIPHKIPQHQPGFSQGYNKQSGQVDSRFETSQSSFPSSSSNSEQLGESFGQEWRPTSSSFSFEQGDSDSDCPDTGIDLRINGLACQQAVTQYGSYLCYTHEYTSRDCCHVCKPRKNSLRTGCEYGDHAELCSTIAPADCYDLRNRYSCCQTCEKLRRSNLPAGCEYGDMTIRCENVRQNPGLCYIPDNLRLCCETCSQIRNATNQGCPWGDYNPNLCQLFEENTVNIRINCYSQQRRKLCCQSCERLKEWISGGLPANCQYGDRPVIFTTSQFGRLTCSNLFSYFNVDECRTNEAVAINCCQTCHRLLNSRG